jgi:hypothetical protein
MLLAKDLRELEGELVCDQCGKPVWHLANDNSRQCECGALKGLIVWHSAA